MKRILTLTALTAIAAFALLSCSKPVSDAELKQAYLFYVDAPTSLTTIISTSDTDALVAETLSNNDKSFLRATEINPAEAKTKLTNSFKDFHPSTAKTVTINGEVVLTSLLNKFFLNGELRFSGIKPAKLIFKNVQLEQKTEQGVVSFYPVDGFVTADNRKIPADVLFNEILK